MAANVEQRSRNELVSQFCTITGADQEVGRRLLEACNDNLDMAIGMHIDQGGVDAIEAEVPSSSSSARLPAGVHGDGREPGAASTATAGLSQEEEALNGIRAPIPQRHEVLVEEAPKVSGFRSMRPSRRSVFDGFRDFQAEARQQENLIVTGQSYEKKHTLEDLFRPPIDITHKGTFLTARDLGTAENKWLLVNLQNVQEFACQVLNRDIWSNITVKALVKKNFIFWQVYHDSEEGKKYMQFYKVHAWPHVAVIDPVTGENMITWDKVQISSFADLVRDFLADHPNPENPDAPPPAKRVKRENSIVDASEEAQLEAAIQASLSSHSSRQPAASSPSATATSTSATATATNNNLAANLGLDSDLSEYESDELETFTGSDDDSNEGSRPAVTTNNNRERPTSSSVSTSSSSQQQQRRNFLAVSGRTVSPHRGAGSGGVRSSDFGSSVGGVGSSSSLTSGAGAAAGLPSPRHLLSNPAGEDISLPSTSGMSRDREVARLVVEDSENENSVGFRESYTNTPNSVDLMGSRSSEFHNLDSSSCNSNSSSLVSSSLAPAALLDGADNNNEDSPGSDRLGRGGSAAVTSGKEDDSLPADSPSWLKHFGDAADPSTNLVIRFPDGKKEQLSLPCSSKLQALFVFCSSKGFSHDSYELVVNFPRRSLSSLSPSSTIREANLHPQETIFVQAR